MDLASSRATGKAAMAGNWLVDSAVCVCVCVCVSKTLISEMLESSDCILRMMKGIDDEHDK